MHKQRDFVIFAAMNRTIVFNSINELIVRKSPVEETLRAIVSQVMKQEDFALARIWLLEKSDVCSDSCRMRSERTDHERCLYLTASEGRSLEGEKVWTELDGSFERLPIGARKIGYVAGTGESVHVENIQITEPSWVLNEDWIKNEKIVGSAAHPLKFQDDILGVLAVFSRRSLSREGFEWLGVFAEQASIAIANARAFEEIEELRQRLEDENNYLKEEIQETAPHKFLIGKSPAWQKVLEQIGLVGSTDTTVLLTGESGTGKEMVARALHEASSRRNRPLVKVNCAAVSTELFESEFFGHAKGAFTGAFKDRKGRFELADGGTLFLDEIGELSPSMQGKLLRVLQEKQFERVGEGVTRTVDVRVIAATNRDLEREVEIGNFRRDLFYRLSVFPIHLPPLRERLEDIEPLSDHFLKRFASKMHCASLKLTAENLKTLGSYWYPGNVRELQNMIERAIILSQCSMLKFSVPQAIEQVMVKETASADAAQQILTYEELKNLERENIIRTLRQTNYKIYGRGGAAEMLGTKPTTLFSRIKALQIPMRPSDD